MALQEYTCTKCEEKFKAPNFECQLGGRHQLPAKTYYAPAANLRTYVSEERLIDNPATGIPRPIPARSVEFVGGKLQTTDAQEQFSLDTEDNGLISKGQWEEIFIDKDRRIKMKEQEADRKIAEANEILAAAKAKVAGDADLVGAAKARVK